MPGPMPWFIGEKLRELGVEILNSDITGKTYQDRKLITGDSPSPPTMSARRRPRPFSRRSAQVNRVPTERHRRDRCFLTGGAVVGDTLTLVSA
jgi:hypothetical protein